MLKKVLITGANGFLGRHVLAPLIARGYEVHACHWTHSPDMSFLGSDACTWHKANLLDAGVAARLMAQIQPTHVLHLAWYTEHRKYWMSDLNYAWVAASETLMQEFARVKGKRLVVAGTCAEYGLPYGICKEDARLPQPDTIYGIAKHSLQLLTDAFARESGMSVGWGRIFSPFGPGEPRQKLVPSVTLSLLKNMPAHCTHGTQVRDFLYVEDVADAFAALVDSNVEGPINIGSGNPMPVKDMVLAIAVHLGKEQLVQLGALDPKVDDPPEIVADTTRLRSELGWLPKHHLREAIEKTIAYWKLTESEPVASAKPR